MTKPQAGRGCGGHWGLSELELRQAELVGPAAVGVVGVVLGTGDGSPHELEQLHQHPWRMHQRRGQLGVFLLEVEGEQVLGVLPRVGQLVLAGESVRLLQVVQCRRAVLRVVQHPGQQQQLPGALGRIGLAGQLGAELVDRVSGHATAGEHSADPLGRSGCFAGARCRRCRRLPERRMCRRRPLVFLSRVVLTYHYNNIIIKISQLFTLAKPPSLPHNIKETGGIYGIFWSIW